MHLLGKPLAFSRLISRRSTTKGKNMLGGKIALAMLIAIFAILPGALSAQTPDYTLYIEQGVLTINGSGGADLNVWGFTTINGAPPMVPGPALEASEGQTLTVRVVNNHTMDHNFVIQGVTTDTTAISAGGSRDYTFTVPNAGIFFYRDTLNSNVNRSMGLHGALTVRTAGGAKNAWSGGPAFDHERNWVVSDMDKSRWNDVAGSGGNVNTSVFQPNYFLLNGQGGFDGMHDPNSTLDGNIGETFLVRILNAGQYDQSLHFHGAHLQVISRNGARLSTPEWQDTINAKAGQTMMILYTLRDGIFPMHIHTAQMETANGVYLNGTATLVIGN